MRGICRRAAVPVAVRIVSEPHPAACAERFGSVRFERGGGAKGIDALPKGGCMAQAATRVVLGIDPGLANTGWGVIEQTGSRLSCRAYGCISTPARMDLSRRLAKVHEQIGAVARRFEPTCVGIETVWFGQNVTAAFDTGQARGAALVACAECGLSVGEFTPRQIKLAVVGEGTADKTQVQYMVRQILRLEELPRPDHAADALAAAICYVTHGPAC